MSKLPLAPKMEGEEKDLPTFEVPPRMEKGAFLGVVKIGIFRHGIVGKSVMTRFP